MKKKLISIFSFLLIVQGFFAQDIKEKSNYSMGCGGFTLGYGNMNVSKLHNFVPENFSSFTNNHVVVGATGHGIINGFVIGGSGFSMMGDEMKSDSLKVSLSEGIGTFDVGFVILNRERIKIYSMVGLGGGAYGLQLTKFRNLSIDDVVNDAGHEINCGMSSMIADISLTVNLIPILTYDEIENSYSGFMTGLKIGYLFGLPTSNWSYSGGDITNGPTFGINMIYAKLIIGGFGYQKK